MAAKSISVDKKTEATIRTVENLKASASVLKELTTASMNYQKASLKLSEEGKKLADSLQKLGQLTSNDMGASITKLADLHRNVETKRDAMCRSLQDDLVAAIQRNSKNEEIELSQFEGDYKKARVTARGKIEKLEQNSKKAGKKGAAALQESIRDLDLAVKEADRVKADKLRQVLLIERKKYCNFLTQWNAVLSTEIDMYLDGMKFKEQQSFYTNLAASHNNLPPEMEALISSQQERTFVQIQSEGGDLGGGYSGSFYNDPSSSYDTSYDTGYSDSYGGGGDSYGGGGSTCSALYDFAGDQPTDLPFYAGDVITITADDDGSGWMTGQLNGRTGIFPTSYVQRN